MVAKCKCRGMTLASAHCRLGTFYDFADSNCLPCHMPPVEVAPHLMLTDHWVRVQRSAETSE
jgi:hypothetical protein